MKKIENYPQDFKNARNDVDWSQEKTAEKLDTSPRQIQYIEEDGRIPKTLLFLLSCKLFNPDPSSYMGSDDEEAENT